MIDADLVHTRRNEQAIVDMSVGATVWSIGPGSSVAGAAHFNATFRSCFAVFAGAFATATDSMEHVHIEEPIVQLCESE